MGRYKLVKGERFTKRAPHNYKGMTEEEKDSFRITYNTEEYEGYDSAKEWVHENMGYIKFTVDKILDYYKYYKYIKFKRDFYNEGVLVVLDRFPKYKPGLRGINSWLYQQITWYVSKLIRRKYIRHYRNTVGGKMIDNRRSMTSPSPEDILIVREEAAEELKKQGMRLTNEGSLVKIK